MNQDLIKRLRTRNGRADGFGLGPVCDEAASALEVAERMVQALRMLEECSTEELHKAFQACRKVRREWESL